VKKIYIVIPKFDGEKEIKKCLTSLQLIKIPQKWQVGVIIVDNSKKSKRERISNSPYSYTSRSLQSYTPIFLFNQKNLGFAGGVNVGIREALKNGAEAVLLLNQDTVVEKNFLSFLLENPADIVGPVIKFKRGEKWIYDFGGKVKWWGNKHIESYKLRINGLADYKLDYVSGCAMLIRRRVFEKIGFFDERYFLYFEDVDFCLRAKKAGFKIAVEPKSVIIHQFKEGRKKPLWQRWEAVKSNLIFINRWICWWKKPLAWGFWVARGVRILIG